MAPPKPFGERLRGGEKLIGSWVTLNNFRTTELLVETGFDFLIVDMQHGEPTEEGLLWLLGAFRGSRVTPVVRVPHHEYRTINRVLDAGFPAILVPLITSVEQAEQVVRAAKYPPLGNRSYGPLRPAAQSRPATEYLEEANASTTVAVLIEHVFALRDLDRILAVPGVDAVFVGPFDLAFSLGESDETEALGNAFVEEAKKAGRGPEAVGSFPFPGGLLAQEILHKAREKGVPFGIISGTPQEALAWFERGAQWPTLLNDFSFLRGAATAGLKEIRKGLGGK